MHAAGLFKNMVSVRPMIQCCFPGCKWLFFAAGLSLEEVQELFTAEYGKGSVLPTADTDIGGDPL